MSEDIAVNEQDEVKFYEPDPAAVLSVSTTMPAEIPPEEPLVMKRIVVEVLSDGAMKLTSTPQLEPWALMGLFSTLAKQLGG